MKAKFASHCDSCGEQIIRGKEISKDPDGNWVHKYCVENSIELP